MKISLRHIRMEDVLEHNDESDTPSPIGSCSGESSSSRLRALTKKLDSAIVKPRTLLVNPLVRYKWKRTVGAGAFGRVQLVRSLDDGYCYAIKTIKKSQVVGHHDISHTNNEAAILSMIRSDGRCAFIIDLAEIFQDSVNLYMVMEYVPGGELATLLRDNCFEEPHARFYLCEILVALVFLHDRGIMYRDLKPENILIGRDGHIKLADFGFASRCASSKALVGTPDYIAPEIILGEEYTHAVDYYAYGVLMYELLVGRTPYHNPEVDFLDAQSRLVAMSRDIIAGPQAIRWPDMVQPMAKDLITSLMWVNPRWRLGNMEGGVYDILDHPWFTGVNWRDVQERRIQPPYIPELNGDDDATAFELHSDTDAYLFDPLRRQPSERDEHGKHFKEFPYVSAAVQSRRWI